MLRFILLIDKGNHKKESGQISKFLDVSALVELAGQKSKCFEEDLLKLVDLKNISDL